MYSKYILNTIYTKIASSDFMLEIIYQLVYHSFVTKGIIYIIAHYKCTYIHVKKKGAIMSNYFTGPRIKTLIITTIGCILYAIGINAFLIPHHLLSGGISGIAIILYFVTGISAGLFNLVLNIPILYAAYRWLGSWAVVCAVYGTISLSFFMDEFAWMSGPAFQAAFPTSPLVGSLTGGIIIGIGSGMIYKVGSNTGGIDPIAQIVRKYWGLQMGSVIFAINTVILTISVFLFSLESAVITLIGIYITAAVTNKVVLGLQQQKSVYIISYKSAEISHAITHNLGRGATLLDGTGAYTNEPKKVILAVVNLTQVVKLKNIVEAIDPNAFMLISDASEVIGQGFTLPPPQAVVQALISSPSEEEKKSVLEKTEFDMAKHKESYKNKQMARTLDRKWFHM